jgi:predicted RNase H-like nuclease (RuvC/YqgF family)
MLMNYIMKLKISVVKMEHKRLYEIKIEQLEKENQELKLKLEKQDLIKEGYKEEISKWNKKYKDLKKQITNG